MKKNVKCPFMFLLIIFCILFYLTGMVFALSTQKGDIQDYCWCEMVPAAEEEGKVVFRTWYYNEYFSEAVSDFQRKYDIKVDLRIIDREKLFDQVMKEKDRIYGTIDVITVDGMWAKEALEDELFYGPLEEILPESSKVDEDFWEIQEGMSTQKYLIPFLQDQSVILYNPERISNPPQTWKEFEEWINTHPQEFGFSDPTRGISGQAFIYTVIKETTGGIEKYKGDREVVSEKVSDWNITWEWFNKHMDDLVIANSDDHAIDLIIEGKVSMVFAWDNHIRERMEKEEILSQMGIYIPVMGTVGDGDTLGLLSNAQNKAAAVVFINYLVTKEQQTKKLNMTGAYPVRTDIELGNILLAVERKKNKITWFPSPYKKYMIDEFTKNVLKK